jgi:hypothetical protein
MTTRPNGTQRCAKNCALPFCLPLEILPPQPVANLRIAPQCPGAAARHICQDYIVCRIIFQRSGICEPALHSIAERRNPLPQLRKTLRAGLTGHDPRSRVPLRKNQRLSSGGRATIQNRAATRRQFRHQLRSFILETNTACAKRFASGYVT